MQIQKLIDRLTELRALHGPNIWLMVELEEELFELKRVVQIEVAEPINATALVIVAEPFPQE
jgi:hypothetical protein